MVLFAHRSGKQQCCYRSNERSAFWKFVRLTWNIKYLIRVIEGFLLAILRTPKQRLSELSDFRICLLRFKKRLKSCLNNIRLGPYHCHSAEFGDGSIKFWRPEILVKEVEMGELEQVKKLSNKLKSSFRKILLSLLVLLLASFDYLLRRYIEFSVLFSFSF